MSVCEWLSHCGELYHSPGAATGTKWGSSCRFKKDVFSTACETAVRIIFFFLFAPICAVMEKLLQMWYHEQCCQSIQLTLQEVKKGSLLSFWLRFPLTVLKSGFILPVLASHMLDGRNKNILCI